MFCSCSFAQEYLKAMMMELHGDKVERKELKTLASLDEMKEMCEGKLCAGIINQMKLNLMPRKNKYEYLGFLADTKR